MPLHSAKFSPLGSADRQGADPVGELERRGSGVEDDAVGKAIAESVSHPDEVTGGVAVGRCVGLDLEAEHCLSSEFGDDVDFVAPVFLTQVIQTRPGFGSCELGSELSDDEGVEQTAKEVDVA
jgi:hypothetical protein